ncbi:MAG: hypothetical protein H6712_09015 [Myxococcales bacterium]|nr:hypothetical protein [Myxococcales bacterium]MCB9713981.1 hypothetical protein [Myxococcales bacterium]
MRWLAPLLLVIAASNLDCHTARETDRWPCPGDGIIRARTGLCECDTEGRSFYGSGWGKACAACNAQDGNGDSCFCDDGTLMRNEIVECVGCPESCDAIECIPPGCALACDPAPSCSAGTTCSVDAVCVQCEPGMCGAECGGCPLGELCIDGSCEPGLLCCLGDNTGKICSRRADFCIIPPVFEPRPGARCYCNVLNGEGVERCDRPFQGIIAAPGQACG